VGTKGLWKELLVPIKANETPGSFGREVARQTTFHVRVQPFRVIELSVKKRAVHTSLEQSPVAPGDPPDVDSTTELFESGPL